jgi:hypothetical protein
MADNDRARSRGVAVARKALPVAAVTLALVADLAAGRPRAEDAWNPFVTNDAARRTGRTPSSPPSDVRPPLPPMGGHLLGQPSPGTRPQVDRDGAPPAVYGPAPGPAPALPGSTAAPGLGLGGPATAPGAYAPLTAPGSDGITIAPLPPPDGAPAPIAPGAATARTAIGSLLPAALWDGVDASTVERLVAALPDAGRSPVLAGLWRQVWSHPATVPAAGAQFEAIRLEALWRAGQVAEIAARAASADLADPLIALIVARREIALGERDAGCGKARTAAGAMKQLPPQLAAEALLMSSYCAVSSKGRGAAELAAGLIRDARVEAPIPLAVLDALAGARRSEPQLPQIVRTIDYRFLELGGPVDARALIDRAELALLAILAELPGDGAGRVRAAEAAARAGAVDGDGLTRAYREARPGADPAERRAEAARRVMSGGDPSGQLVSALLAEARRAGILHPVSRAVTAAIAGSRTPAAGVALLSAGDIEGARSLFATGGQELRHWLVLVDVADPAPRRPRGQELDALERLALQGRFAPDALHRVVTVLDALDYLIPIPLWEAASRTPQPASGYLPPTGILQQLQVASGKRQVGLTVLLAVASLGPAGAEGANLLALGDTIRALRRAGLEAEARRLALEALIAVWPP